MADVVKPEVRSKMMSGIRGKDTQPELVIRRALYHRGVRFRLHEASLPGRPDIVIQKHRVVVLVHGCFWHAHEGCRYFRVPSNNRSFWEEKLAGNQKRDARNLSALHAAGWRTVVVWECAIRAAPKAVVDTVLRFLQSDTSFLEIEPPLSPSCCEKMQSSKSI